MYHYTWLALGDLCTYILACKSIQHLWGCVPVSFNHFWGNHQIALFFFKADKYHFLGLNFSCVV